MIHIEEKQTNKLPGKTSLFVESSYNPLIVETIKQCDVFNYNKKTTTWEVPLTSLSFLLERLSQIDDIELILLKDEHKKEYEIYPLSDYKTTPYQYQIDGIEYGMNNSKWLLLDAPGLGKTLQLIYLAQELKKKENIEHCLIICGLNTLKNNWKDEIHKHSDMSCMILGERKTKNGKIRIGSVQERLDDLKRPIEEFFVVTNIQTIRDSNIVSAIKNGPNKFDMIILDEGHVCKSPTSIQGKNLLKLSAKYMILATGTILMNSPLDAYVPLKWIGADRSTYTNFKFYYCNFTGQFNNILLGYRNMDILKDQLDDVSLRRTKDLLDLPEKTIITEYVDMNDKQHSFYDNIKEGIIQQVDKVKMSTASLLAMVTRLRQATACPSILTTENIPSSKIERAVDLAKQIIENGDKVVIFSAFKDSLYELEKEFSGIDYVLCHGDISDNDINVFKNRFQEDSNCKVMLATWQKMGTGITLTSASYAIFLDTPWTNAVFLQAQDRIHRIGSKKPVFIYNLVCKDTIDERVLELVESKGAISDYVVDDIVTESAMESLKKYIEDLV